jgi:predicted  nucleic acid-binding Zn-ribbon protein
MHRLDKLQAELVEIAARLGASDALVAELRADRDAWRAQAETAQQQAQTAQQQVQEMLQQLSERRPGLFARLFRKAG